MNAESVRTFADLEALAAWKDRYEAETRLYVAGWRPEQIHRLRFLKLLVERGHIQETVL